MSPDNASPISPSNVKVMDKLRVVICWSTISGYMVACWKALAGREGIDLHIIVFEPNPAENAPFDLQLVQGLSVQTLPRSYGSNAAQFAQVVAAHKPDVVVVSGWMYPAYVQLGFQPALRQVRLLAGMDTNAGSSWRHRLARLKIGKFIDRLDGMIVAGERSWQLAMQLKVPESKIYRGVYAYDHHLFADCLANRLKESPTWPRRFLFVGRYVPSKGVLTLLDAFAEYQSRSTNPWMLGCCGTGELRDRIRGAVGVEDFGFVQPKDQPGIFARHGVLVLPSHWEPWGVIVAEALGAGLPVIATEQVGSSVELIRSYFNGLMVASKNVEHLARAMLWMEQHVDRLPQMAANAIDAARPFGADFWAERWEAAIKPLTATDVGPEWMVEKMK